MMSLREEVSQELKEAGFKKLYEDNIVVAKFHIARGTTGAFALYEGPWPDRMIQALQERGVSAWMDKGTLWAKV